MGDGWHGDAKKHLNWKMMTARTLKKGSDIGNDESGVGPSQVIDNTDITLIIRGYFNR